MTKKIEENSEFKGYGRLVSIFNKIHLAIYKFGMRFKRLANRFAFEQFKMIFGERDDDIYIVSFPKSGTTLTQMLLYQMITDGNMDFDHIYEVSPWIRNASFLRDPVPQISGRRIIKSHDYYHYFKSKPKGKFIFVYRNGMDTALSHYHQNKNYNNPDLTLNDYTSKSFKNSKKTWFKFCKAWFKNKKKFPVIYVRYEDLLGNKEQEIKRIAEYFDIPLNNEIIKRTIERTSFEFMKSHEDKFGDKPKKKKEKVFDQFIRKGKIGEGKEKFTEEQQSQFKKLYEKHVRQLENKIFGT